MKRSTAQLKLCCYQSSALWQLSMESVGWYVYAQLAHLLSNVSVTHPDAGELELKNHIHLMFLWNINTKIYDEAMSCPTIEVM